MYSAKCPRCGEKLSGSKRKCRACGTELVICSECGTVSRKGTETCNMCGKLLVRQKRVAKRHTRATTDSSAPNDLVSVINYIKRENIFYKILMVLKSVMLIAFCILLAVVTVFGILFSRTIREVALALAQGCSISAIGELILGIVPQNIELWRGFADGLFNDGLSFGAAVDFFNYMVFAIAPAVVVAAIGISAVFIPLDIAETVICGIAAGKRGYNGADTVAVFECPSLIYKSEDSFDKAYICFPFLQGIGGRGVAIVTEAVFYLSNLLYCSMAVAVVLLLGILGVVLHVLSLDLVLAACVVLVIAVYMLTVLALSFIVYVLVRALKAGQLKKWSEMV